jgi:anti-sigma B factor antagonist
MKIGQRQNGAVTIVELDGRLIFDEGDVMLRDCVNGLVRQGYTKILIDMKGVTRLDSAGIGMIVAKYVTAYMRGGRLKLPNLTNRGETLMDITKLVTVFDIFEDEEEAVKSFSLDESRQRKPPGQ